MVDSHFIAARVSPETKARLRALAAQRQTSESALLKRLLEMTLEGAPEAHLTNASSAPKVARDARLYVRLWHVAEIETLVSERGTKVEFCADCWILVNPVEGTRQLTALSIRGFRGHFLKIRYSAPEEFANSDEGASELTAINNDLAEFVELYGGR